MKTNFNHFTWLLSIAIISFIAFVAFTSSSNADVYVMGNNVNVQSNPSPLELPELCPQVIPPQKPVAVTPVKQCSVTEQDFSNYIKRPYHDPDLGRESVQSPIVTHQTSGVMPEYESKMNQICANYFAARRARNFNDYNTHVYDRQVVDREVMSFQKFAESCENFANNNRIIHTGLTESRVGDNELPISDFGSPVGGGNEIPIDDFGSPVGESQEMQY